MTSLRLYSSLVAGGAAIAAASVVYWVRSHRKSPEQLEAERRQWLNATGRIIDGTVLDVHELTLDERTVQLLIYNYDVAGVGYECSQDITHLRQFVDLHNCKLGLPASVKYDPHNPGNSIVVAEGWMGLRQ